MRDSPATADAECVAFLQWALPRLGLRWSGFRRVRRQVCRRVQRRQAELGLPDLAAYRALLDRSPGEWATLGRLCRVTISRFLRDREVFRRLGEEILPALAERAQRGGRSRVRAWSVGCANGEEPYGLSLAWRLGAAGARRGVELSILACDVDLAVLARARRRLYPTASLRELPARWRDAAFAPLADDLHLLRSEHAAPVDLVALDVRGALPEAELDVVLCRNLVFTYFAESEQLRVGGELISRLTPGGVLVVGGHERVPERLVETMLEPLGGCLHRRRR